MYPRRSIFWLSIWLLTFTGPYPATAQGASDDGPPRGSRRGLASSGGTLCHVPSKAAGQVGVAVRVLAPTKPRFEDGAPVIIHVAGGVSAGEAGGPPELTGLGFVEVYFAFPGGGRGDQASGGSYDYRGPQSIRALADVIRFASGRLTDTKGRTIDDLVKPAKVLHENYGLIGSSHGGNACGVVMATHGEEFPDLAFYVSMESPYGEGNVNVELGDARTGVNPAYNPRTGVLDLARLAWSGSMSPSSFRFAGPAVERLRGALYFDLDGDGRLSEGRDFPAHVFVGDAGQGLKAYYSPRLIREAERRSLFGKQRPDHLPTLAESEEFWRWRDAAGSIPEAVRKCPKVGVIVYAGERDHVQASPDHPHILMQVEGFREAKCRFVRLNPDRCYVEKLLQYGPPKRMGFRGQFPDNDAGRAWDRPTIREGLEPSGLPINLFIQAAVCEMADRTHASNWSSNLEKPLYPDAPSTPVVGPPLGRGGRETDLPPRRPQENRRGLRPGGRQRGQDSPLETPPSESPARRSAVQPATSSPATAASTRGYMTFVVNVHDWFHASESADTLLRLIGIFEKHRVRGDFYLTAPILEAYELKRPDVVKRLRESGLTVSYHFRPPHPGYKGFQQRLSGLDDQALRATLRDYETYRMDLATGDLDRTNPGGYAYVKQVFGRPPVVVSALSHDPRIKTALLDIYRDMGAQMTMEYHESGTDPERPFVRRQGLLIRPSDFSITRWALPGESQESFWWNRLPTPQAAEYNPTARLESQVVEWKGPRPPLITSLIHENDFNRKGPVGWSSVYYVHPDGGPPQKPPFDLKASDRSQQRAREESEAIWRAYEEMVAYAAGHLTVVTSADIVKMAAASQ